MPEYLAPGVYVEETSFRTKSIEGVSTSTAGFIGCARFGPTSGEPELLTSFADFERIYGGLDTIGGRTNYLAHGVRAFFSEGGARLYCMRVVDDGSAKAARCELDKEGEKVRLLRARFVGAAGNIEVTLNERLSRNTFQKLGGSIALTGVHDLDTVQIHVEEGEDDAKKEFEGVYDVERDGDEWKLSRPETEPKSITLNEKTGAISPESIPGDGPALTAETIKSVKVVTMDVEIRRPVIRPQRPSEKFGPVEALGTFAPHPKHPQSFSGHFREEPSSRLLHLTVPFALVAEGEESALPANGVDMLALLVPADSKVHQLQEGKDGGVPPASAFEGKEAGIHKTGLRAFEDVEDISILAAPGYSAADYGETATRTIQSHLINHCEKMRYRIAVLDAPPEQTVSTVLDVRGQIDSTRAAFYYPWVRILDPVTRAEANMPPSGFVAGIYARNDVEHGVHKSPANEVVRLALSFEVILNKAQQDALNPEGVNCFRFFEGRGYRLWGARTATSDSEWKYVNVRRYFMFLERSIEKGTQWVVFENNNELLWSKVRQTVEDFLYAEFAAGHLMGAKPEEAYFVRCDRSTMTQNDLDNGRLICLVGVAPARPAEFVIFRIGQFTADSRR